jgi:hypothetical protein
MNKLNYLYLYISCKFMPDSGIRTWQSVLRLKAYGGGMLDPDRHDTAHLNTIGSKSNPGTGVFLQLRQASIRDSAFHSVPFEHLRKSFTTISINQ